MNAYDASEQAYKRGYEAGQRDARKKGRWVNGGLFSDIAKCSVCGSKHFTMDFVCANKFSYCPNCGADMRGEEDG